MNTTRTRAPFLGVLTSAVLALGFLVPGAAASADTAPPDPSSPASPPTVAADGLPTAQIDGVAWSQVVVGDTVYVAGKFTTARPAGAAPGVNTVPRNNLMAYNINTGVMTSFAPNLNAQALAITASPDGSRIYVVGDFTTVNGAGYYRVAAFSTATGQVIPSFKPILGSQGRAVHATNTTVYLGGTFRTVSGVARDFLAAVNASDGSVVSSFTATADATVNALTLTKDGGKLVVGGRFANLSGNTNVRGLGAVDPATGASSGWAASSLVRNAGTQAAIMSLYATNDRVYGSGYVFGAGGNLEGIFSADPADGAIKWIEDCHGDTYSVFTLGDAVYGAGHPHYCGNIGGFPQTDPWTMHYAFAFSKAATGTITADPMGYFNWAGNPSPTLLNWFPTLVQGSYTGQGQAGWSVSGNDKYVTYAGEFPYVNGVAQYGLVRFAIPSIAPNKVAPIVNAELVPSLASFKTGEVRISWTATHDHDNANLTYKLVRDGATNSPIYTTTQLSNFYTRPQMGFIDKGLVPGSSHSYRVYATDPFGNSVSRLSGTVTVATTDGGGAYEDSVQADAPKYYWPLDESGGTTAYDHVGFNDLRLSAGVTRGAAGPTPPQTASTFSGTTTGLGVTPAAEPGPNTFTTETWIRTTTTTGGKIIGFGNSATGSSGSYDRHVYMDNAGRIFFGVYNGAVRTVNSTASFNDGQWHHVAATLGAGGMVLYVDGKVVGSRTDVVAGQAYSGYWRVGGDNLNSWTNRPSSAYFKGDIAHVAVYPTVLSRVALVDHFVASGRTSPIPPAPADAYGAAVHSLDPTIYWRLADTTGSKAADSGPYENLGTYNGTVVKGQAGALSGTSNAAARFTTSSGVGSDAQFVNPTVYSLELWFKTTTTVGGKLIGFGSSKSGLSSNYDRHVYMQNDGRLVFGTYTGVQNMITTATAYNDGAWHHVVAMQSGAGMKLYLDGQLAGTNPQTAAQAFTGFWRIAGDNTWGSTSPYFAGTLDEVAVYGSALSASDVNQHYALGATGTNPNQLPTAAFTSSIDNLDASFDGSGSIDPDGTITKYEWNFGDTTTGLGATPTHTYAAGGNYTVTLKVTDNQGGTSTVSHPVSAVANADPVADFDSTVTHLSAALDATGSTDSDGTVQTYAWNFGDTTTGSGATTSHLYANPGTYTVTLTVTDDDGATDVIAKPVTVTAPPPNQLPTASFTATPSNLQVTFDGSASSDPDGQITGYAWNFGDNTSGSGVTTTHGYAAAGTYTVVLTVTDNQGGIGTLSQPVTVTAPVVTELARDDFARTVASGWGSAVVGGAWTIGGTATPLRVAEGTGQVNLPAGSTRTMTLGAVSSSSTDVEVKFSLDTIPTGGGTYATVVGRQSGTANYVANAWVKPTGVVQLVIKQGATVVGTAVVPGITYTAGMQLQMRMQVIGASPTTIRARIWAVGQPEPTTWLVSVIDSTAGLQGAGNVGLQYNVTTSSTQAANVRFDDFIVRVP